MARIRGQRSAFGHPGIEPRWTRGAKDGVGTSYSAASLIWFTMWNGIITEVFYPTLDQPQTRDFQFLITDGRTFFHEEKRHLKSQTERLADHVLGYRVRSADPDGRYTLVKQVIADPHLPCVLQHVHLEGDPDFLRTLRVYALCAPHMEVGGSGNNGYVAETAGQRLLVANRGETWLAVAASEPFSKLSCGYVGASDGWTDLNDNYTMDWEFDTALNGNIALTGEIALRDGFQFSIALGFGHRSMQAAVNATLQALAVPFATQRAKFLGQWRRACDRMRPLGSNAGDGGNLYHASYSVLMGHEDKTYPGALIASMSIPWGETRGDDDIGGYHLVWTRDMVNSASGLLAAGNVETPMRALVYLAASQSADGGFPQNFWLDGTPHWRGIQLDQAAFPIMLAWKMEGAGARWDFDPYPMVLRAAAFLVRNGPATQQERWEEASGYSPSTLAATIAGLICAACFARKRGDEATARFLEEYADFIERRIERWTVTTDGVLFPGIRRHYIRILPTRFGDPRPSEDPNAGVLGIANRAPGSQWEFPAKDVVDPGFLELVRYGIRRPGDALIEDSLRVVDAVLKVDAPVGRSWRRYNHDGYGQQDDGGPYIGWGRGRAWPLLTGERAHYELAAGRDATHLIRAIEGFATPTGMLPEQVWDEADRPELFMFLGKPTGAAMPLMWAHAEYIKLLRSAQDGQVFDLIPEVASRYLRSRPAHKSVEVWKFNRQVAELTAGETLRIQAPAPFVLRWTADRWQTFADAKASGTSLGIHFVDVPSAPGQRAPIQFTFHWPAGGRWEGRDYLVEVTRKP